MRGRFGRGRVLSSGGAAWLGVGALAIILALIVKRPEESFEAVTTAFRTGWERLLRGPEQSTRQGTDSHAEQADQLVAQERDYEVEIESNPLEGEGGSSEEATGSEGVTASRRDEEADGKEEGSPINESTANVEEGLPGTEVLPIEQYDSLTVTQVTQRLRELSLEEVEQLRDYEAEHRNRRSIMQRFETRIRAARKNLSKRSDTETEQDYGQ